MVERASEGDMGGVAVWIGLGISKDFQTDEGRTAVRVAAASGQYHILEFLLTEGADPRIRDNNGLNAFDVARDFKTKEILSRWLNEHEGAQRP